MDGTMNSPSDLSGQLDEAWLRCSPLVRMGGIPRLQPWGGRQAALLLSLIDSPDEEAKRLHSSNDRKRILRLHELLAADSDYWSSLDQTHRQDGIDTLDTLTDWAKGEHH
jgi:hypothetical protein